VSTRLRAQAAPALFVVLWSSGFSFVAMGLEHAEPITFLALRYVIVVAVLVAAALVVRPPLPHGAAAWRQLIVIGLVLQAAYFSLFYLALERIPSATVALVVCLQPVLVALAAPRMVGEHVPAARWAGLVVGLVGAVVVILARSSDPGGTDAGGLALAVAALLAISGATLHERRSGTEQHLVTANLVQYTAALAVTGPVALLFEGLHVEWTGELVVSLTYLVFANSLLAITLLLTMVRRGEASRVSSLFFLVPPLAALIAWVVLGESLPALAWVGLVLAAAGVAVATRAQ
jgi:drug/metabolite transporter (DMT)-like permease